MKKFKIKMDLTFLTFLTFLTRSGLAPEEDQESGFAAEEDRESGFAPEEDRESGLAPEEDLNCDFARCKFAVPRPRNYSPASLGWTKMKMGCCALSFLLALDCVQGGRGSSVIER